MILRRSSAPAKAGAQESRTQRLWLWAPAFAGALGLLVTACDGSKPLIKREPDRLHFPAADRPVASVVSTRWSDEESRDRVNEAELVMDRAAIRPGMTVADIGAGEGYYTIRLAQRVGAGGRVLAEDIFPQVRDALAERVARERLDNVSVRLGEAADPKLPPDSFDRVLMVHMYHEIAQPYEFLWRLRPALKPDGLVVVVDADRPTRNHGTPPELLDCEFRAVGYVPVARAAMASAGGYLATYRAEGPRPEPGTIRACRMAPPTPTPAPAAPHGGRG